MGLGNIIQNYFVLQLARPESQDPPTLRTLERSAELATCGDALDYSDAGDVHRPLNSMLMKVSWLQVVKYVLRMYRNLKINS